MVTILDTTLREGALHPGVYFTPESRRAVALALAEIGTKRIELPIVYPFRGGKMEDINELLAELKAYNVETIIQCRAYKPDIELATQFDATGFGVFIAVTEEHRKHKLGGMSLDDAVSQLVESLDLIKSYKYRRAVLEDVARFFTQYRGSEDTAENFAKALRAITEAKPTVISIPDSAGIMPFGSVKSFFEEAKKHTSVPLAAHFHNDYGLALANTLDAVFAGAEEAHVSMLGIGSKNGIADHYEVVANLEDNFDIKTGENRDGFVNLYRIFEEAAGIPIPSRHPLSLQSQTERAGTHQAQQIRSPAGYVPMKKLQHDFQNKIWHEAGEVMSKRIIGELLNGHEKGGEMEKESLDMLTNTVAARSALKHRKLLPEEVRDIIESVTGIDLDVKRISKTIYGSNFGYVLINLRPDFAGRIISEELKKWPEVERINETYGEVDMVVFTKLNDSHGNSVVDKIREKFSDGIVKTTTWIIES